MKDGLYKFNPSSKSFRRFTLLDNGLTSSISSIVAYDGNLWIGTKGGVVHMGPNGKILKDVSINAMGQYNLEFKYPAGLYLLKISNSNQTTTHKIVKRSNN